MRRRKPSGRFARPPVPPAWLRVSRTKIPPYPPATASRGVPAPMSWRIRRRRGAGIACAHSLARAARFVACRHDRVVGKAALDDLGAQLEGLAGDPGLERARLLVTARRAASSPASAKSRSAWAPRSGSSRDCRSELSRPPVSDNLCRRRIRPGPPTSVPHPPPRGLPRPSPGSWKARVSPSSAGCSSAATTAPVSRSTACSGL